MLAGRIAVKFVVQPSAGRTLAPSTLSSTPARNLMSVISVELPSGTILILAFPALFDQDLSLLSTGR